MNRSYLADEIDREYRREQFYKRRKRQTCREKDCMKCGFFEVCMEGGEKND